MSNQPESTTVEPSVNQGDAERMHPAKPYWDLLDFLKTHQLEPVNRWTCLHEVAGLRKCRNHGCKPRREGLGKWFAGASYYADQTGEVVILLTRPSKLDLATLLKLAGLAIELDLDLTIYGGSPTWSYLVFRRKPWPGQEAVPGGWVEGSGWAGVDRARVRFGGQGHPGSRPGGQPASNLGGR